MRTISPTLVAEVRFGVARYRSFTGPPVGDNFDMASTLGFAGAAGNFIAQMNRPLSFPAFTVSGYGGLGNGNQAFTDQGGTSYEWAGSLTKSTGAHTLKAGVDFRVLQAVGPNSVNTSGVFTFTPSYTQGPNPTQAGSTSGDAMAALLTGLGQGSVQIIPRLMTSNRYFAAYFQDDFHLTKKLTLNLGLRYDLETGRTERYNQLSWFNFTAPSPLAQLVPSLPNLHGGLEFPNVNGNPKNQFNLDPNNFGPRVGLAYSLTPATVLRAGYGVFYEPYSGRAESSGAGYSGFAAVTTWISSLDGITPLNKLSNAFPTGLTKALGSSRGLLTGVGDALGATTRDGAFDRTARASYIQQWNFSVQRSLPGRLVIELAYTGAKGTKLTDGSGFEEN